MACVYRSGRRLLAFPSESLRPVYYGSVFQEIVVNGCEVMRDKDNRTSPKRQYPPFYERVVPIALGIIALTIVVLLLIIFAVAMGFLPGAG